MVVKRTEVQGAPSTALTESPQLGFKPRLLLASRHLTTPLGSVDKELFFFLIYFIYLFLAVLGRVFVAARGLSLVVASRGYSSLQCPGFSLQWLLLFRSTGSRCAGFSSCSTQAQQLCLASCRAQTQ